MRVRARPKEWSPSVPSPVPEGAPFRRPFIYPHRSFRYVPLTTGRIAIALGAAFGLSLLMGWAMPLLAAWHDRALRMLLGLAGLPVTGWSGAWLWPVSGAESGALPQIAVPDLAEAEQAILGTFAASALALLYLHRRFPLLRGLVFFALILLLAGLLGVVLPPAPALDSAAFSLQWLRGEAVTWLVTPWVSAVLFVLFEPRRFSGVEWMLGLQLWLVLLAPLRLTLCLGVLHYTGWLFLPLLWFGAGLLATVVVLLAAYSLSLDDCLKDLWGNRQPRGNEP